MIQILVRQVETYSYNITQRNVLDLFKMGDFYDSNKTYVLIVDHVLNEQVIYETELC